MILRIAAPATPSLRLVGTIYYAVFMVSWGDPVRAIGEMLRNTGVAGISAAVLSLMIIAGKDFVMVLFDWARKAREKSRVEGREEVFERIRDAAPRDRLPEIERIIEETRKTIEWGGSSG